MYALLLTLLCAPFFGAFAQATTWRAANEGIWDTRDQKWITLESLTWAAAPGEIFVFGEEHATADNTVSGTADLAATSIHHDNQTRFILSLQRVMAARSAVVNIGMEFLTYTAQAAVDQFLSGALPEADFLTRARWDSGNPFAFYREQVLAPGKAGGRTFALNVPPDIARDTALKGPAALTPAQRALLPPIWEKGDDAYFARFQAEMQNHTTPAEMENYFWAQSLWDDTMAWKALQTEAKSVLVIIVGVFHMEFGGGLPTELAKQTSAPVKTLMQIEAADWSPTTLQALTTPDPVYGAHADYLWVHTGAVNEDALVDF